MSLAKLSLNASPRNDQEPAIFGWRVFSWLHIMSERRRAPRRSRHVHAKGFGRHSVVIYDSDSDAFLGPTLFRDAPEQSCIA